MPRRQTQPRSGGPRKVALFGIAGVLTLVAAGLAAMGLAVHVATERIDESSAASAPDSLFLKLEDVEFSTDDGLRLRGWWVEGRTGRGTVVLCHDRRGRRESLLDLGFALHEQGFGILLFDFRAHGTSGGSRSTLGRYEERDVNAALEFLDARNPGERIGLYGVGMGAYAAVLSAAGRRDVDVLVLDGLYPDIDFALDRELGAWTSGPGVGAIREAALLLLGGDRDPARSASRQMARLGGRDVLFLASSGDPRLESEIRRMYEEVPVLADSDGNLTVLPVLLGEGLFGDHRTRYHNRVAEFLSSRLSSGRTPG